MKCDKARFIGTLNASTTFDGTNRTFLECILDRRDQILSMLQTNFHRCLGTLSIPVIGSMNTSFATLVSGTQIAQSKWTHSP